VVPGGSTAPALNANDITGLLTKYAGATGVETQQRNPVQNDPRVRGYRVGQLATWGDWGFFSPARADLDTAVGKFDPSSVRDVIVIKGPYTVRLGPGFAFLDIATFDSPRYKDGFKAEGRTFLGYQTNGDKFNALQSISAGDKDWGVRLTYNFMIGDDYHAGEGRPVPGSYNSQNLNIAFGITLDEHQTIEFKALRLYQHDVEFPGLYFDINRLDTEAYSMRYTVKDASFFDLFTLDVWDNYTVANGDTTRANKQAFLTPFLTGLLVSPAQQALGAQIIDHFSSTDFHEGSRGYRAAMGWGEQDTVRLAVGTDMNYVRQELTENIRLQQVGIVNPNLGPQDLTQNLGIPSSHLFDPGMFLDLTAPIGKRLILNGGVRADIAYTNSANRFVSGNLTIVPGTAPPSTGVGQPPAPPTPAIGPVTSFDPIIFSSRPFDGNLGRHFNLWSAYFAGEYKFDEHWNGYAKFGYAERPPTLTELYAAGPFVNVLQQGLNRLVGDPHLNAEQAKQFDIGFNANYPKFRLNVSAFYSWIDNFITFNQNGAANQISQVVYTNTPHATLAGGEILAEYDATKWLTPFFTVNYVQGRDLTHSVDPMSPNLKSSRTTGDTEPLPGIPPLEMRYGFRVHEESKQPKWAVEFLVRTVMQQGEAATSLGEQPTAGFTTLNLRSYWQATKKLLLTAGVENLLDKFYREHLDPQAGNQLFRPGVNVYFGAEVRY
jgi:outer membrane receptor protein involved in Fe transport